MTPLDQGILVEVSGLRAHFFVGIDRKNSRIQLLDEAQRMNVVALHPVGAKIAQLLEPHIERQGYVLVSVEYRKGTRSSLLRLLVDKPGGGIGLNDLEKLSPVLGDLLDVYDPIEGRYTLEVSSPGLNRPLRKLEHFEAVRGERVKIRTHHAHEGQKSFVGKLVEVNPSGIELDDESTRRRVAISFEDMQAANYEYNFDD